MSRSPTPALSHNEAPELRLRQLERIDERLRWLSTWTIHNANHLRESRDGLKVGGHQASCASMTTIMTALYFHALRPQDRVAVKPHASPVFHAAQYLMGRQSREQLERFRAFGGAQSYPSRTKDKDDVDISTGSVGLGVAITAFSALAQDYLDAHGWLDPVRRGRMVATLGDAELDEGNIYECLIEAYKHDIRNVWWIVDYNRQSLDATTADRMFDRFDDIFETAGWRVFTLKWGKKQQRAFALPGGSEIRAWIEACSNAEYAALTYQGGAAWRERLMRDIGRRPHVRALLDGYDDGALHELMVGLGGHCVETLIEAFEAAARDDTPTLFIAYTVKGFGLPLQGHKDNHAGLMTATQVETLRQAMGVPQGEEWSPFAGLGPAEAEELAAFIASTPLAPPSQRRLTAEPIPVPPRETFPRPEGAEQSTQAAFGRILLDLARSGEPIADRIVTTSPDVTVSTNLGGFVNQRGLFRKRNSADVFRDARIPSAQRWAGGRAGQHIELGIAEHNLFLILAALGLTAPHFGQRLLPDRHGLRPVHLPRARCPQLRLLPGRPLHAGGHALGPDPGPEGGAHQSIYTPLIGMGQPGLTYFEPAFVDELAEVMRWSFDHMQASDGGSVYLRLTTRAIAQPSRADDAWVADALRGAYWLAPPAEGARAAIVFCGAIAPEVLDAAAQLAEDVPGLGVLNVVSPGLLHRDWMGARRARWQAGETRESHAERLLAGLAPGAGLVTVIDGSPATLSWLGGVRGMRVSSLGVDAFGQVGDLPDLYRHYRLDADAIVDACAELFGG